jgi:three-Cys-motif partner protein
LEADLQERFPHRQFNVYPGDCNQTIDQVLADLRAWQWAPTFVFADQQGAEIAWSTLAKAARFRTGKWKAELWILMSPTMIAKGVKGTGGAVFAERVDVLYGCDEWRRIQSARERQLISAEDYRDEMVNLLRWRLQATLGYKLTARIPMRMPNGLPIYDMVFATDHPVGDKIMTALYRGAAEREPQMRQEAKARDKRKRDEQSRQGSLFELEPSMIPVADLAWEPSFPWDPVTRAWW